MPGKARDILILERITDFSTTGSAGLTRRNTGRNHNTSFVSDTSMFEHLKWSTLQMRRIITRQMVFYNSVPARI